MGIKKRLHCSGCGAWLELWEDIYEWESGWLCEDCFDARIRELTRRELAELLGGRVLTVEDLCGG